MANGVTDLLDSLYRMIDDARGGLGGTCRINRDDALDLLDEIRNKFPAELSEAKKLITQRNEYLDGAKTDAERIRQQALDRAKQLIDEHEIVRQARAEAARTTAEAEKRANDLKSAANTDCEDAMRRTEDAVNVALNEIRQSRAKFRSVAGMANSSTGSSAAPRRSAPVMYDAAKEEDD
ncbi:MAG: hypothetical protein IJ792_02460 [Oscillospiraceae bacterium]|nr:hypothetical protein [Oscillospiraceae bacterium]